jgi:membrane glycosyltransferase
MTPVIAGLLLAIPLAALSASSSAAQALRGLGLLTIPEERNVPPIVARANELTDNSAFRNKEDAIGRLCENSELRIAHRTMISVAPRRKRGEIDVDLVVGRAKLADAQSREEAAALLSEREIAAVLSDPSAFDQLMALRHVRNDERVGPLIDAG